MGEVFEDGSFVLDQPHEIEMFGLLSLRGRMKLEYRGLKMGPRSALAIARERGITNKRTKLGGYEDLCKLIEELGGPSDDNPITKDTKKLGL